MNKKVKHFIYIVLIGLVSCNQTATRQQSVTNSDTKKINRVSIRIEVDHTSQNTFKVGDRVDFNFESSREELPDSIRLSVDHVYTSTTIPSDKLIHWNSTDSRPGLRVFDFTFYWGDSIQQSESSKIELLSDITPDLFTYKVLKTWPHNTDFYTQGLEFSNGFLYEGTGQYSESVLVKMSLETGEIEQSLNLPKEVFGEGITIFSNKIYQLTWRSSVGYAYDKQTFKKLFEFNYPTEGWGLTHDGSELIMSDGSEIIYFMDAEYFQELRRIEVYDDKGPVKELNELEFVDGLIYANVYQTNEIVAFEASTGKVVRRIDLTGILNPADVTKPVDVLNGIAWNGTPDQLVVTGKWWPKLFLIQLVKK